MLFICGNLSYQFLKLSFKQNITIVLDTMQKKKRKCSMHSTMQIVLLYIMSDIIEESANKLFGIFRMA